MIFFGQLIKFFIKDECKFFKMILTELHVLKGLLITYYLTI